MTAPRITIDLASHERAQLDEYAPQILDHVDIDEEEAEAFAEATIVEHDDGTASATVQDWATIISCLRVIDNDGLRSWWLRKKLAKRLRDFDDSSESSHDSDTRFEKVEVPDAPDVETPADSGGEAAA